MRCDCHVHIVGPVDRHPQAAGRTYLADVATLRQLETAAASRAVRRFVIVQPSFYGTDNTVLLESLDALGERGRGVAVVDPDTTSARMLSAMSTRGVRGVRLNLYSPLRETAPLAARFEAVAGSAYELNWHIEVIAPIKMLIENTALLRDSRVPVVIDHYGLYGDARPGQSEGKALLGLLALPHVWIKLSAPYRVSADALAVKPDADWLAALLASAPDRCLWGSDWPHTPPHDRHEGGDTVVPYRSLRYDRLVDEFVAATGSEQLAEHVLSDNPAKLYGFGDSRSTR
ncbi:MAG TPA: amidohydrolase family protein [Pseudolabrys sp.]|nr:amidohydrolase family protein [Pseudolabrys sp.]